MRNFNDIYSVFVSSFLWMEMAIFQDKNNYSSIVERKENFGMVTPNENTG